MSEKEASAPGIAGSIWESLRSHVNERSKSPFAGAFLFSWIAVNWQQLLVLAFSQATIEARIASVAPHFAQAENVVFFPLLMATVVAVCYYMAAVVFLGLYETYRLLGGWVQRNFEKREWMPAPRFAQLKSKYLEQIERLHKLAADNTDELAAASSLTAEARLEAGQAKSSLELVSGKLAVENARTSNLVSEKSALTEQLDLSRSVIDAQRQKFADMAKIFMPVHGLLGEKAEALSSIRLRLDNIKPKRGTAVETSAIARLQGLSSIDSSKEDVVEIQFEIQLLSESLIAAQEDIRTALLQVASKSA